MKYKLIQVVEKDGVGDEAVTVWGVAEDMAIGDIEVLVAEQFTGARWWVIDNIWSLSDKEGELAVNITPGQ